MAVTIKGWDFSEIYDEQMARKTQAEDDANTIAIVADMLDESGNEFGLVLREISKRMRPPKPVAGEHLRTGDIVTVRDGRYYRCQGWDDHAVGMVAYSIFKGEPVSIVERGGTPVNSERFLHGTLTANEVRQMEGLTPLQPPSGDYTIYLTYSWDED